MEKEVREDTARIQRLLVLFCPFKEITLSCPLLGGRMKCEVQFFGNTLLKVMQYKVNEPKKNKHKTEQIALFFTVPATQKNNKKLKVINMKTYWFILFKHYFHSTQ